MEAWQVALAASGLPFASVDASANPRARIAFAAPLPAASAGAAELADIWLVDRVPRWTVREALRDRMPEAHRWVDAEDVWLGAPALPGRVVAAEWRIEVGVASRAEIEEAAVRDAAQRLLSVRSLPRVRVKGAGEKRYDLRPLLADINVERVPDARSPGVGRSLALRIRTRFDPILGAGRPEEVIAAIGEVVGLDLEVVASLRERLVLADDDAEGERPMALGQPRHD
jgi:hypothetical protein